MQQAIDQVAETGIAAVPVGKTSLNCLHYKLKIKRWTLQITKAPSTECDAVLGKHVTLLDVDTLRSLSEPFLLPYPDGLYLQTSSLENKVC